MTRSPGMRGPRVISPLNPFLGAQSEAISSLLLLAGIVIEVSERMETLIWVFKQWAGY